MGPQQTDGTLAIELPFAAPETEAPLPAAELPQMNDAEVKEAQKTLLADSVDETIRRQQHGLMSEQVKFEFQQRLARSFAASGYFEDLKGLQQQQAIARAIVKIQLGDALGLSPMESMQSVYMVNGRPTVDAQIRAARMKRYGYDWDILRLDDKGCKLQIKRGGAAIEGAIVEFTDEHAKAAELLGKGGQMYKKYPRNMYFARAITNAQRWYAPEVLNGANMLDTTEAAEIEDAKAPGRPLFTKDPA